MPIFIALIIIQVFLVVHVIRTGRDTQWIFILLLFPLVGGLAYLIVELIPEWRGSRTARKVRETATATVDPHRELRAAKQRLDDCDTPRNRSDLADLLIKHHQYNDALKLYQSCLEGIYEQDPKFLLGAATAEFGLAQYEDVITTLDRLREHNPDFKSADGHLLYARSHLELGRNEAALEEFESLANYHPSAEVLVRLARLLAANNQNDRARQCYERVLFVTKNASKRLLDEQAVWIAEAKHELSK